MVVRGITRCVGKPQVEPHRLSGLDRQIVYVVGQAHLLHAFDTVFDVKFESIVATWMTRQLVADHGELARVLPLVGEKVGGKAYVVARTHFLLPDPSLDLVETDG